MLQYLNIQKYLSFLLTDEKKIYSIQFLYKANACVYLNKWHGLLISFIVISY